MKMKLTTEHLKDFELLDSVRDQSALLRNISKRISLSSINNAETLTQVKALIHVGTVLADSVNAPTFQSEMADANAVFELTKKMALEAERVSLKREEEMDRAIKRMAELKRKEHQSTITSEAPRGEH